MLLFVILLQLFLSLFHLSFISLAVLIYFQIDGLVVLFHFGLLLLKVGVNGVGLQLK